MRAGSLSFLLLSLAIPPPAPAVLPPGWPAYASAVVAADGSVPYEQSVRMQKVLRESEVECDLITVPDGTHGTRVGREATRTRGPGRGLARREDEERMKR